MPRKRNQQENTSYALGGLEARMESVKEKIERIEKKLDELVEIVAASKGSIRTLIALGSVVAGASAVVTTVIHWLIGRHP